MSLRLRLRVSLTSLLFVACSTPSPAATDAAGSDGAVTPDAVTPDAPNDLVVCPTQHTETLGGRVIVVCDVAYDTAPLVRLPEDSATVAYGGLGHAMTGQLAILARDREIALDGSPTWVDAEKTSPMPRYAYYLYRATLVGGAVVDATPVVRIDSLVFRRLLAGLELEGVASRRDGDGTYEVTTRDVPIRIHLDTDVSTGVHGTIDNASAPALASDGTCIPALSALGEASPIFGRDDGRVSVDRYPAMHVPFDDVFVFAWSSDDPSGMNMGGGLYVPPIALARATAPVLTDATNAPHGNPTSGPSATLSVVHGGGGTCTL